MLAVREDFSGADVLAGREDFSALMWGRLPTGGRLSIGLSGRAAIKGSRRKGSHFVWLRPCRVVIQTVTALFGLALGSIAQTGPNPVGIFEGHADVGTVLHPGSVEYDAAKKTYKISASG